MPDFKPGAPCKSGAPPRFLINIIFLLSIPYLILALTSLSAQAQSKKSIQFIRDAEIEQTIRTYAAPILRSAGLPPERVRLYIIENRTINAFVAGGQRMFFHTGLLLSSDTPLDLIGVIAHETGHIAGGHLVRTREALSQAAATQAAGIVLGVGAAVAGAGGDVATGLMMGGQGMAQQNFLSYSRTQESAADHAALRYLAENQLSARGLHAILKKLEGQEILIGASQNPYVRSHPINRDRLASVKKHISQEPPGLNHPPEWEMLHQRMLAKLRGFLWSEARVYRTYPETDQSFQARYARAIADYRSGHTEQAQNALAALLDQHPDDAYLYALKGQIAFEMNQFDAAVSHYGEAARLKPRSALILAAYGQALMVLQTAEDSQKALEALNASVQIDPNQPRTWHNLATIYSRLGENGKAALAAAERFYRTNNTQSAQIQIKRALELLPVGSPERQRAQDIDFALSASRPD